MNCQIRVCRDPNCNNFHVKGKSCQYPHPIPRESENGVVSCKFRVCKDPNCTDFHIKGKRQIPTCDIATCIGLDCRFAHTCEPNHYHDCIYFPCKNAKCLDFHKDGQQLIFPCNNLKCPTKIRLDQKYFEYIKKSNEEYIKELDIKICNMEKEEKELKRKRKM